MVSYYSLPGLINNRLVLKDLELPRLNITVWGLDNLDT